MATHPTFYVGMLKAYLDPSAGVETDATCGSSSGEGRQSMAPLERLSEPEEQVALEDKQDTPRDTQIVPKRMQEPGLSSSSVAQGSSPGPPGSSYIDIDPSSVFCIFTANDSTRTFNCSRRCRWRSWNFSHCRRRRSSEWSWLSRTWTRSFSSDSSCRHVAKRSWQWFKEL
uniref:Uncharacterized protein n=1 Tax=Hyaloperonospora arabidopsidis (strain Emoy2) TaxID=559515 RepID=M4C6I0_HYAAE